MSISSNVTPSALASRIALVFVPSLVAKPGSVNARMSRRGRCSRSIARAATISAWVESSPPDTPITTFGCPIARSRCSSPADLDAVGLVAVLLQPRRVRRHEREPRDVAAQSDVARRRVQPEVDPAEHVGPVGVVASVVVERPHPQALRPQQVQVDVGHRAAWALREPLRLGEQDAVLPDHRLAVPGEVGGRLALARRRVHVGREAPRRRGPAQQAAVVGPADGDRAAGEVGQHGRSGERAPPRWAAPAPTCPRRSRRAARTPARRRRRTAGRGRTGPRRRRAGPSAQVVAGRDLPPLVELAVGRQVRLGHHAEDAPAVHDDRRVVDPVPVPQRGADDQHRQQVRRSRRRRRAAPAPRRRAACPAAGRPRSSSRRGSARGRRPGRRPRRRTPGQPP